MGTLINSGPERGLKSRLGFWQGAATGDRKATQLLVTTYSWSVKMGRLDPLARGSSPFNIVKDFPSTWWGKEATD